MQRQILVLACSCALANTAGATTLFSFASDSNPDGPTFFGHPDDLSLMNHLEDGSGMDGGAPVVVSLLVDVNGDAPGGAASVDSVFSFEGMTGAYSVSPVSGGFLHTYAMSGSFHFVQAGTGLDVLQIDFSNALFTSFSNDQFALGTTATLQASALTDPALAFTPGQVLSGLGVAAASLASGQGFAFSLTNMIHPDDPIIPLHLGQEGSWFHHWTAEGSFSAVASAVPAPGAMALLSGAMLIRRRRR